MGGLNLLFPRRCAVCQCRTPDFLCPDCEKKLPYVERQLGDCLSVFYYREPLRRMLIRYKFMGRSAYADFLGAHMAACVRNHAGPMPQMVVWIPSSFRRKRKRGYDQSRRLAAVVARELHLPLRRALIKVRHTHSQTQMKTRTEREENVAGAFRALCAFERERLLLVDDIYTTGATMRECRALLQKAGAGDIIGLTAARR